MNEVVPEILRHVLENLHVLLIRDALLDLFTETEKSKAVLVDDRLAKPIDHTHIYTGKLLDIGDHLYCVIGAKGIHLNKGEVVSVTPLGIPTTNRLFYRNSKITLTKGQISNYKGDDDLYTTAGRLLLNYVILVDPFGDLIPYINEEWKIDRIEENYIFEGLRSGALSVEQIKHYSRNLHWLGHFTELAVPSFTERSLTVDPKIIARRDELLREHRAEIDAGNATVMNRIEAELVAMDRASLKGDESTRFYDRDDKSYEVHRKMMMIMGGMIPKFGEKGFGFIETSLEEGWKVEDFPTICNEVRRGSFARSKETAKGGEETKFVIRIFQNTKIIEDDCGSQKYLHVTLTKDIADKYLHRNILVDGALVTLSPDNISTYIGQTVFMRSPLYCHTNAGYCFTCMGELFRSINQELLTMIGVNISSSFTKAALKAKHFSQTRAIKITSLNQFVI